ncbi:pyridoxal phosphate-dependent aminotransferase [Chelativorans intermedius]|uniref:Aminotransferase n=1 Tax=Chelativorans intermedius TaxID=515947 RepID=A0ABV6DAM4_9HYPH|nr:pyridoxal phosphate-dependent aminotransferase [Chelativorans intermedius]MCT9000127.1 pyridoxal phosphate-dependent aminotransferase [Chelativorans intermedius]
MSVLTSPHDSTPFRRARRAAGLALSDIVQISEESARLKAQGRDIVALSTGEPDFPTPAHAIEAAHEAARSGLTKYPPTAGLKSLRAAIAARAPGPEVGPESVLVSTGAKQVLAMAMLATLDPGEEVILPAPCWSSYGDIVTMAGGRAVFVPCPVEAGFKLAPHALAAAITSRTRWLLLNSPSNPSGATYGAGALAALAEVLRAHPRVWVLSDEIYEHLSYVPFVSLREVAPDLAGRMLVVNGVSKAYAMTGWRIGWGIGPAALIDAMEAVQGQITSGACAIAQAAALAALEGDQEILGQRRAVMRARRDRVVAALNATGLIDCPVPEGAFYVFPSCMRILGLRTPQGEVLEDDRAFCRSLLQDHGVAVVPGSAFGLPGHFRLSFAYSNETLSAGLERIAKAVSSLQGTAR